MGERNPLPPYLARDMRWLPDPATLMVQPLAAQRRRRRRRLLLLAMLVGVVFCATYGLLRFFELVQPPVPSPVAAVSPPGLRSEVPPHPAVAPEADSPALQLDYELGPQAMVATLLSDNQDLSFARRAGLHRADNPLQLTASASYAVDADSGEVLYKRNERIILPIASLTKLVTAMVLLDSGVSLGKRITITSDDIDRMRHSRSRLPVGTQLTRDVALRLALMSSENRAAHALGRTFPGGMVEFVRRMNLKAHQLKALHARFVDPTGLSNANQATARDLASIVVGAANYHQIRLYSTTARYAVKLGKGRLTYVNSNRLVRYERWPLAVQKTGYIVEAGQCLAMMMQVAGRSVVVVLLDAGSIDHRSQDARKLRQWLSAHDARAAQQRQTIEMESEP